MMAKVIIKDLNKGKYTSQEEFAQARHDQFESALKKFKREVQAEGILRETRARMYYVSKSEKRKAKQKAGRRKQLKKMWQDRRYSEY